MIAWHYDEMKQVGTDYADAKEVEAYDARMRKIRDIRSETEKILESLHITQDQTLLEIGCGTGEFAIAAGASPPSGFLEDNSASACIFIAKRRREVLS